MLTDIENVKLMWHIASTSCMQVKIKVILKIQ